MGNPAEYGVLAICCLCPQVKREKEAYSFEPNK